MPSPPKKYQAPPPRKKPFKIPSEITDILNELTSRLTQFAWNSCPDAVYLKKVALIGDGCFLIRGFIIACFQNRSSTHFLIQLERLRARSKIDLEQACLDYRLSPREAQVVQLLVHGLINKEIASQLHLSEPTVKEYLHKVMVKMGATTRCGVVSKILSIAYADVPDLGVEASPAPQVSLS